MGTEENKAVVREFANAVWRQRDLEAFDRYFSPAYRDAEIRSDPRAGLKQFFAGYFGNRPDFRLTSEELTAEDDRVVQYITGEFTNTQEQKGPLGAALVMHEINSFTVANGQIVSRIGIGHSVPVGD